MITDLVGISLWALGTAVFSGIGAYVGAYLKEKNKTLASEEDLAKVLNEVRAIAITTKKMEAEISSEMWVRQKRWELKREILLQATRRLRDLEDGLFSFDSVLQLESKEQKEGQPGWIEAKEAKFEKWSNASSGFDDTRLLVNMICQPETIAAFEEFGMLMNEVATKISPGKDVAIYTSSLPLREKKQAEVRAAVRKELGIDAPTSTS
jgi:hypothetical protein